MASAPYPDIQPLKTCHPRGEPVGSGEPPIATHRPPYSGSSKRMSRSRVLAAIIAPLLAATAASPTPAAAQVSEQTFRSGRTTDLATLCAASEADMAGTAARAWCQGFIVSAAQYHGSIAAADPSHERIYCQPDPNLTLDEVRARFVAW